MGCFLPGTVRQLTRVVQGGHMPGLASVSRHIHPDDVAPTPRVGIPPH